MKEVRSCPCPLRFGLCHSVIRECVNFSFWKKLKLEGALESSVDVGCSWLDEVVAEQHDP